MIDWDGLLNAPVMETFGGAAIYERPGQMRFDLPGIHDVRHLEVIYDSGAPASGSEVTLSVQLSRFPLGFTPAQGDRVQVATRTWTVQDVRPDAEGWAALVLSARTRAD